MNRSSDAEDMFSNSAHTSALRRLATPISKLVNGAQYICITAGGSGVAMYLPSMSCYLAGRLLLNQRYSMLDMSNLAVSQFLAKYPYPTCAMVISDEH